MQSRYPQVTVSFTEVLRIAEEGVTAVAIRARVGDGG